MKMIKQQSKKQWKNSSTARVWLTYYMNYFIEINMLKSEMIDTINVCMYVQMYIIYCKTTFLVTTLFGGKLVCYNYFSSSSLIFTSVLITTTDQLFFCGEKYSQWQGFCIPFQYFSHANAWWYRVYESQMILFNNVSFKMGLIQNHKLQLGSFTKISFLVKIKMQWNLLPLPFCKKQGHIHV